MRELTSEELNGRRGSVERGIKGENFAVTTSLKAVSLRGQAIGNIGRFI